MAQWDSADLLSRLRRVLGRDSLASDTELTDAVGYGYLGDAQRRITQVVAQYIPAVMYGTPVQLTTADNKVYSLPSGEWMGQVEVYASLNGDRLREGDYADTWADFTVEGPSSIRITAGRERVFSDGPYARFITKPGLLDGSTAPTLKPAEALQAVVYEAAAAFAERDGTMDARRFRQMAHEELWGVNGIGGVIPTYRMMFAPGAPTADWWRSPDLG